MSDGGDWINNMPDINNPLGSEPIAIATTGTIGNSGLGTNGKAGSFNTWIGDSSGGYTIAPNSTGPYIVSNPNNTGGHTITTNNSQWSSISADNDTLIIRTKDGDEVTGDEIMLMKKFLEKDPDFQKFKKQEEIKKKLREDA